MPIESHRITAAQVGKLSWCEYPTLTVAIHPIYYFIINPLNVFSHDIFDPILYTYLCQKIWPVICRIVFDHE